MGFGLGSFGLGALGGGFGDPFDDGTKGQNKEIAARLAEIRKLFGQAQGDTGVGFGQALAENARGVGAINKAYDRSASGAMRLAESTKRSVLGNVPAAQSAANMDLGARGFGNSTLSALADRGVRGDTTRSLQAIDNFFSDRLASLETQRQAQLGDVYRGNAGLISQRTRQGAQLNSTLAQILQEFAIQGKKPSTANQLLGLGAQVAGAAYGAS